MYETMTHSKMRRFYFRLKSANQIDCVWAHSLPEAKAKAALTWLHWWQDIEWLNPVAVTDPQIHD